MGTPWGAVFLTLAKFILSGHFSVGHRPSVTDEQTLPKEGTIPAQSAGQVQKKITTF